MDARVFAIRHMRQYSRRLVMGGSVAVFPASKVSTRTPETDCAVERSRSILQQCAVDVNYHHLL
jgi:hypothetical protein